MNGFIESHLSQLVEAEAIILVIGFGWNIFREMRQGAYLKKVLSEVNETANSPLVSMLRKALSPTNEN